jgi:hypothetical protein
MGISPVPHNVPPPPFTFGIRWVLVSTTLSLALSSSPADAEDRILQIANAAGIPGQTLQIPLNLSSLVDFAGGDFLLSFNPDALSIEDVDRTDRTDDFLVAEGNPGTGLFSISMAAAESLQGTESGTILLLTVQINAAAVQGGLTSVKLREARWYDESSVRHEILADNGLVRIGSTIPEEVPLTLGMESGATEPGGTVQLGLSITMAEGISHLEGDLTFDPGIVGVPSFTPLGDLNAWQITLTPSAGGVHFKLQGEDELSGLDPLLLGVWSIGVSLMAVPSSVSDLGLENIRIENLEGLAFDVAIAEASIEVHGDGETPTPTVEASATSSLTPSEPLQATPSPTRTAPQTTPTFSPTPLVSVDFDSSGEVDEKDLIRFLEIWKQEAQR